MPIKEKDIEHEILTYLNSLPGAFAFKVNTTGFFDTKRQCFRRNRSPFIIKGTADIICCYNGRFLAIEVKTPRAYKNATQRPGKRDYDQRAFLDKVKHTGGVPMLVDSLGMVVALVTSIFFSKNGNLPEDMRILSQV